MNGGKKISTEVPQSGARGAVFIEFVFSALTLLFVLIVTIEAALAGFRSLGAQYVASRTARELSLHQVPVSSVIGAKVFAHQLSLTLGLPTPVPKGSSYRSYPKGERTEYAGTDKAAIGDAIKKKLLSSQVAKRNGDAAFVNTIWICPAMDLDANRRCTTSGIGEPQEYVAVRVQTTSPFLMGWLRLTLAGFAMARNELRP